MCELDNILLGVAVFLAELLHSLDQQFLKRAIFIFGYLLSHDCKRRPN